MSVKTLFGRFRTPAKVVMILAICLSPLFLTGCVHEFPEAGQPRNVVLNISHNVGWTYHEMTITRGDRPAYVPESPSSCARYHLKVFPQGDRTIVLAETEFFVSDLTRADFSRSINLPPGDYDLFIWSDYADLNSQKSYFFDSDDFGQIRYSEPYNGNNELRDAFRGEVSFTVDDNVDDAYYKEVDVTLERPLARYEFISTDLDVFLKGEAARIGTLESAQSGATRFPIDGYSVKMVYSGYMPSVFNNFSNKPVDSATGVSYTADVVKLNETEARLGFDYVMVNGRESSVKVSLEVYDPEGKMVGRTSPIDVVTKRSMNTTVRGKFLTSKVAGGVGIDPSFNGSFNVPVD